MSEEDYSIDYENQCVAAWAADSGHYTEYRLNFSMYFVKFEKKIWELHTHFLYIFV